MLLTRLVSYARDSSRVLPPFYKTQRVRWILDLNSDGSPKSGRLVPLANPDVPAQKNGVEYVIPSITKTSGIAPQIAVDTPEYLFGWVAKDAKPDRVRKAHDAFRALTDAWIRADPDSPARSLQRFLSGGHVECFTPPEGWSRGDLVAVRVHDGTSLGGAFLHETDSARRFWATVASARKGAGSTGLCLVCGQVGELLKTIPQQLPARLVPQATQSASLVSVNKATHGFGLQEQLVHTPVCVGCGLAVMGALESLLNDQWKSALAGQDTRLAWWVTGEVDFTLDPLDDPRAHPEQVARMLGGPVRGRQADALDEEDLSTFCALAIGGNVSRVVVREWIELPLKRVQHNLASWFDDHEIIDFWEQDTRYTGLGRMAMASGRWLADRKAYAKFGASGEDRPDGIYQALLRSALLAKPLPPKLLAHLVHRIRADGRLDTERAALLRLALVRRPGISHPEAYMPALNPDHHQPAYLAGRIFAVLEDIQLSAVRAGGDQAPNVTFTDRYFSRAVTSPAVALVAGRRDARAWLKRMRRDKPAWAYRAEERLDDLFAQLAAAGGIPHGAVLADQAAFILGYHQQRAAMRVERATKTTDQTPQDEGALA
ncbi:type I-C CRISPR-associated protein Cas8c/Csd1 [Microtetraspora fusca]|uniref:Type I-C CRISPR-associated protein Cas8c/Csd1 n=1 Tax=Microtetraspora fusca TaxID=1997 RepID=A0ABW6V3D1_MICFU